MLVQHTIFTEHVEIFPKSDYLKDGDSSQLSPTLAAPIGQDKFAVHSHTFSDSLQNLVSSKGYMQDVYNVSCRGVNWVSGWEISKILFDKKIDKRSGKREYNNVKITGFFEGVDNEEGDQEMSVEGEGDEGGIGNIEDMEEM